MLTEGGGILKKVLGGAVWAMTHLRASKIEADMQRILAIEDDRRIHKMLKLAFEPEGYALEVAADGPSGLAAFRSIKPAVVILDLMLPKLTGREVIREIRKEAPGQPV